MPWRYLERLANVPEPFLLLPDGKGARRQWVAWKAVPNPKKVKPDKIPVDVHNGHGASTTNSATWARFWDALNFYRDWHGREHSHSYRGKILTGPVIGVGFVLTADDPFVGIDIDDCVDQGQIQPWAQEIIQLLDSYTEISPSGTGIRIFTQGDLPFDGRKSGKIEVYKQRRYLTVTGDRICMPLN